MANIYRTHNCNELRIENVGEEVRLSRICSKNKKFRKDGFH